MQNWKIKRMGDGEIKANINACNKFLRVYGGGNYMQETNCLFCEISTSFHLSAQDCPERARKCHFCLWKIIEGESCEYFSRREFGGMVVSVKHKASWQKFRILMLRRWKKILKIELARRVELGL